MSLRRDGSRNAVSGIRAQGFLRQKACRVTGIGRLAGKEAHSRRVMKEGARAERGTVLFGLSGFSGPPNQTDRREQIDQLPAMRREMLDCKT